ncbi:G2/mitotic-specific cyclin S13-6 [Sesamum alatum]|uniref:feruloyl-CoA 6-hydroxylase n=1 Tax=Sesamum alatum TaxID=300844 RepID=A0AAE1Z3V7_9LAMI|nr:G2/mitotic-specific cyclin S13-6 [Sesamum alatum]
MSELLSEPEKLIDFMLNKGNGVKGLSQINLKQIPDRFIQPHEERLDRIQVATQESVPVIDVSNWEDPGVSESICEAAAKWGFFQIINHGIPDEVLENVKRAAHDFFELPVEKRRRYLKENSPSHTVMLKTSFSPLAEKVLEWKDYLMHFCDGQETEDSKFWPPVSRDQVLDYVNWTKPVIRKLLTVLLNGINVKQIDEVKESALMGSQVVTLLYYPKCPNPNLAAGAGRHSDVSSITILLQDDVGGLYVRATEGDQFHIAPTKGALVVNIGDVLQIMSNDRYKSIEHRVFVNGSKNRVSVPVFVNPSSDAVIGPLPEVLEPREKPIYKQVVYSDYFNYFFSKVATDNPEEGEAGNGRLQVFLSSFWASLGGVFGGNSNNQKEPESEEEELDLEMASRAVVPEQPRVGGGKQKNVQAEGRNRRVLRDIGNLVAAPAVEGKPQNQITRPMTRSFGAQLLANAQAAAEKNNCKKPLADNVNVLVGKDGAAKAKAMPKKEPGIKAKNDVLVVVGPDEEGSPKSGAKMKEVSSRKSGKSLTAILTARSKAACGLTKKPRDLPVDIDAADKENELAAVEYVEDMYNFYKLTEEDGRVHDYMDSQPDINSKMRAILVDWLIEVHKKFELVPESLYLTINIVDRFLSVKTVPRRELQLVGISSMLIACKYEEIWAPEVSDFIAISDNAYVREQVLLMEKAILGKLEWYLTVPTPYVFLVRYIKASVPADKEMENMAFFFAELGLMNYSTIINYSPSKLSASAVYVARCTLNRSPLWTETLKHYTGYSEDQLMECAKMLASFHHSGAVESKLKAVSRKYTDPERNAVALFPPAKNLLPAQVVI